MALKDFLYIQAYISVSVCIISIGATLTEAGKVNKTKRSSSDEETSPQNTSKFSKIYPRIGKFRDYNPGIERKSYIR